jgi:hypothetical protein
MPLPAGFKVNGSKVEKNSRASVPPRVKKIVALLDKLPSGDLLTTLELADRLGLYCNGGAAQSAILLEYREKVDNKLFWGSRKSILQLRKQLAEPEENND